MLAVIAVIALIVSATAPTLFSAMKANRLSGAGMELIARISLAQQMAVSRNHEVELRFYNFSEADDPGSEPHYRSMLIVKPATAAGGSPEILSDMSFMRDGIVIGATKELCPILEDSDRKSENDSEERIPSATATYKSIRFRPDGTCDIGLVPNEAYFTVVEQNDIRGSSTDIPKNFFAVQIDPYTSRCVTYRPE